MPYSSNDLRGSLSDQFNWFCQQVSKTQATSDLISLVAGEAIYVNFCRDIVSAGKGYQRKFGAFCRKNKFDENVIRRRLGKVATVLGVGKHMDYYKILGVKPDADDKAIRQAYRMKAQIFHPDKVHGDKTTSDRFVELHAAYVHLTDPSLRQVYDQSGEDYADWAEGDNSDVFKTQGQSPGFGRFFGWLSVLVGALMCIIYLFDLYQSESIPVSDSQSDEALLEESNEKFRSALRKMSRADSSDTASSISTARVDPTVKKFKIPGPPVAGPVQAGTRSDSGDATLFYNPRRDKRYWSSADAKHDTLKGAIFSLATTYKRTPAWVNKHMGDDNKIRSIHRNLKEQQALETSDINKLDAKVVVPAPEKKISAIAKAPAKKAVTKPRAAPKAAKKITDAPKKQVPDAATAPVKDRTPVKAIAVPTQEQRPLPKKVTPVASAKTSAIQEAKAADAAKQLDKRRILAFLKNYTTAYEQKDFGRFQTFFTSDAMEMGKPFKSLLPTYQKTFQRVEALLYDIDMESFSADKAARTIHLNGVFEAKYRLPEREWTTLSGSIRMELSDSATGLRVRLLEYEMDQ